MSKKHPNLRLNKMDYLKYRDKLYSQNIKSFYDQSGHLYTNCPDCIRKNCAAEGSGSGCMLGEISEELEAVIK